MISRLAVGIQCNAGLGTGIPGQNTQAVSGDDSRDGIEVRADERRIDPAAVTPEAQVAKLFQVTREIVQGFALRRCFEGMIGHAPEARPIERIDLAQAQLKRPKHSFAIVEVRRVPRSVPYARRSAAEIRADRIETAQTACATAVWRRLP